MPFSRFCLYWRTLRFLRPKQLLYYIVRRVLRYPRSIRRPSCVSIRRGFSVLSPLVANETFLGDNRFCFLGCSHDFQTEIDWNSGELATLWEYNLHYFDYLRQRELDECKGLALIDNWIERNPIGVGIGWDPYPVSLRLVNWVYFLFTRQQSSVIEARHIQSIAAQSAWLCRNLEYHILANHFFENIKALLFIGTLLGGKFGDELRETGMRHLKAQLKEQFLSDGGHFERSPMYHAILTQDLLDLCNLSSCNLGIFPTEEEEAIVNLAIMALNYLYKIDPPDHSVPFFNDAANAIAPTLEQLAGYADRIFGYSIPCRAVALAVENLDASGYYVIREDQNFMMIDCGAIGPDFQPGHAHCDTLSYEYFLDGSKLITNCGNFDYELSEERCYARSTAAHNTVVIDGEEQSEIWGAFRVARRASPVRASVTKLDEKHAKFSGAHDGYKRLRHGVVHQRDIDYEAGGTFWIRDTVLGHGTHTAESHIHFVAGLEVDRVGEDFHVIDVDACVILKIRPFGADAADIMATERYPEFGRKEDALSLRISKSGTAPFRFGYEVRP